MRIEIRSGSKPGRGLQDLVTQWLLNALGLVLVSRLVPGVRFHADGAESALTVFFASAVLGLLNLLLKPLLILVTLPITLVTLGLFLLVINAVVLLICSALVQGFEVTGFWSAVWGSLLLSAISLVLGGLLGGKATVNVERGA